MVPRSVVDARYHHQLPHLTPMVTRASLSRARPANPSGAMHGWWCDADTGVARARVRGERRRCGARPGRTPAPSSFGARVAATRADGATAGRGRAARIPGARRRDVPDRSGAAATTDGRDGTA